MEEKIIGVMASRRRAMTELGRVTFSPDTTSGGGSPRVSLRGLPKSKCNKTTEEVRKIKIQHTYTVNEHARRILPTASLPPRGGVSDSETHQVSLEVFQIPRHTRSL